MAAKPSLIRASTSWRRSSKRAFSAAKRSLWRLPNPLSHVSNRARRSSASSLPCLLSRRPAHWLGGPCPALLTVRACLGRLGPLWDPGVAAALTGRGRQLNGRYRCHRALRVACGAGISVTSIADSYTYKFQKSWYGGVTGVGGAYKGCGTARSGGGGRLRRKRGGRASMMPRKGWRRRMGIEPTHRGLNPEHWI
jgi:hypothetical protein